MERLVINLHVPLAVQGSNFIYTLNCKEMKQHTLCRDLQKAKDVLEKSTGVNFDHYYCLASSKKKRKSRQEQQQQQQRQASKKRLVGLGRGLWNRFEAIAQGDVGAECF